MNEEDLKKIDKSKDAFTAMAKTKLKFPRVDSDLAILNPKLTYDSKSFDYMTADHKPLVLEYQCLKNEGEAVVELNIEFDYYKSITLFFKKCCHSGLLHGELQNQSKGNYSIFFIFFIVFAIIYFIAITYSFYVSKEPIHDSLTLKSLRARAFKGKVKNFL